MAIKNKKDESKKHESMKGDTKEDKKDTKKSYSAKMAVKGKDIGKPGKAFGKIAKSAAKKYGSVEAGKRVAGSILKKLRTKAK